MSASSGGVVPSSSPASPLPVISFPALGLFCSPLTAAVSYSHAELTKWLLANGADPGLRDHDGDTPLHQCETEECGALLVAAGADPYAENAEGKSPFVVAAEEGRKEMSRWLASLYEAAGKPLPAVEEAEDDEDDEDDDDDEDGDEDEEGADEGGK